MPLVKWPNKRSSMKVDSLTEVPPGCIFGSPAARITPKVCPTPDTRKVNWLGHEHISAKGNAWSYRLVRVVYSVDGTRTVWCSCSLDDARPIARWPALLFNLCSSSICQCVFGTDMESSQ